MIIQIKDIKDNLTHKKMMKINPWFYWFTFVLGVIVTVFIYQAFTIFQYRSEVATDHATLTQVVSFLNAQIQAAQSQTGASANTKVSNQLSAPSHATGTSSVKN